MDAAIKAINAIQLDYYLMKPWDPPEEKLFPIISELLDDSQNAYKPVFRGIKVIGYQFSPKSHEIKEFLPSNLMPYQSLNIKTSQDAAQLVKLNNISLKNLAPLFLEDGRFLIAPDIPHT